MKENNLVDELDMIDQLLEDETIEYPYEVSIRDKVFKFRSWKIKDKKSYLSWTSKIDVNNKQEYNNKIIRGLRQCLVLNCIEGKVSITPDEYQFLLCAIRSKSVNHKIEMTLQCEKCGKDYDFDLDIDKSIKTDCDNFKTIIVEMDKGSLRFEMGRIGSQEVYDDYMNKSESEFEGLFVDFVLHVQKINNKVYSAEDRFKLFNSVDVNVFEEIIKQWEPQRFKVDNVIGVVCTHCKHVEEVIVDDIPGFFPISWTE